MPYRAPVEDILFTLEHVAGLGPALEAGKLGDLSADLVRAIVEEAGRFAGERVAPLLRAGDVHPSRLKDGVVTTPPGWRELYRDWCEGGWNALSGPVEYGGQGLPAMLSVVAQEMWNSGSMAFAVGPTLTIGAVEALAAHGSEALKATYLPKLVSGEWTGTMNLTEPQAGSDLGALKARAERQADGTYRIFGQKIFITYGEHDLTDNIIHLVLARLPDAPAGTRGISLFLVPKILVEADGSLGAHNDLRCAGLEHKLGLHGSPTCVMSYGDGEGAVGYLVGQENRGLACMFTMMNNARLMIGIQGVAVAEAAHQHALAYAQERRQGRAPGWTGEGMSPIVLHPDVKRMLATQKALTGAARALCYACAHALDMAHAAEGDDKVFWTERASLITPLAKAFSTDIGVEAASLGIQIHGGMGFIEETGAAQFLRDARIAPIYEGTNGIQAIDLVTRKLPLSSGRAWRVYLGELSADAHEARAINRPEFGRIGEAVADALRHAETAALWMEETAPRDPAAVLAVATPFLRLMSLAAGGGYLARGAVAAAKAGRDDAPARAALARFYAEHLLCETSALAHQVMTSSDAVATVDLALAM
ncbi:acyl-CoA dehydrogenase [Prosthecodimorpha staleyi]|uniref:3-methylmercaptopropionyl-CoA dehydrogenase n=1 Tax=Prosthecodimorpha staleyi TaxID=2840188 RepID=A0A947D2J5_9HYPH|nr:acyl-CoA dehydrogenase [Prosthecodimorpha staleyi]MBT9288416.1 acyl-CoA dehydrogenase [Prosthecodimorpha staleyi]